MEIEMWDTKMEGMQWIQPNQESNWDVLETPGGYMKQSIFLKKQAKESAKINTFF